MSKKDIDQKLIRLVELTMELSDTHIPVVKYRAEMIMGLLQELMDTVVDKE